MALRPGGRRAAVVSCVIAMYDAPHGPTSPSLHGWWRDHSTTSAPSRCSLGPNEVPRALRRAGAAHVDDDVDVAALDQVHVGGPERALLVVWRLGDDHRVAPGLVGPVDVRAE